MIRIIGTANKIDFNLLKQAKVILQEQGFDLSVWEGLRGNHFRYCATDGERQEILQDALDNPEYNSLLCARGGYGTMRIIDKINFDAFKKHPCRIIGFSDVTTLHNAIAAVSSVPTVHGTMPINFNTNTESAIESLYAAIKGEQLCYKFQGQNNKPGKSSGIVCGGNLAILAALSGTPYDIDTKGKILFLEDVDVYLYEIDRMIQTLKLSGKFEQLAGLVIGQFSGIKDNPDPFGKTVEEIILDAVQDYGFPVAFNFPAGHVEDNRALYLNHQAQLNVDGNTAQLDYDAL